MIYSLKELRLINSRQIDKLLEVKDKNEINQIDINDDLNTQLLIGEMLKDEKCFLKIKLEDAFDILNNLIEKENIKETYMNLISSNNFKKSI